MAQGDFFSDLSNAADKLNQAAKDGVINNSTQEQQMERMLEMYEAINAKKEAGFKWDLKSETIGANIRRWGKGMVDDANNLKKAKKGLKIQQEGINKLNDLELKLIKEGKKETAELVKKKKEQAVLEKEISQVNLNVAKSASSKLGSVMAGFSNFGKSAINLFSPLSGIFSFILGTVFSIGKSLFNILLPIEKAWKMFLEMQKAIGGLSADIGLTNKEYMGLLSRMPMLYSDIAGYGGKIEDIATIIGTFSKNTGKNRLFSNEEIEGIVKLGYSTGLGVDGVTEMVSEFDNLGYSLAKTMKTADKGRKVAAKFSINQTQLLKTTTDVVKNLTGTAFGRSVEDLTKLSAKAQSLRFNLAESVSSFKDAFFSPEKAVEAAAKIQVLGGEMAQQFGDFGSLMYGSMNDADGMSERLMDSVKNLAVKNKNGEFIIPPAQRQILKEQMEALGQNYAEVTKAGIEQARTADKLMELSRTSGSLTNFNDDDQQALANLMTLGKNGYEIKMPNGISKLVSTITSEDQLKNILSARQANENAAQERLNLSERFSIVLDRFAIGLTPLFTKLNEFLADTGTLQKIEDLGRAISTQMIPFIEGIFAPGGTVDTGLRFFLNDFDKFLVDAKKMMDGEGDFFTKIKGVFTTMVKFVVDTILPYVQYIFGNILTAMKDIPAIGPAMNTAGQQLIAKSFQVGKDAEGKPTYNKGTVGMAGGSTEANKLIDVAKKNLTESESSNNFFTRAGSSILNLLEGTANSIVAGGGEYMNAVHGTAFDTEGAQSAARIALELSGAQIVDAFGGAFSKGLDKNSFEMAARDRMRVDEGYNASADDHLKHIGVQDAMLYSDGRLIKGSKGDAIAFIDEMAYGKAHNQSSNNNSSTTMTVNVSGTIEHDTPNGTKNITAKQLYDSDPQMFNQFIKSTMAKGDYGSGNYIVDFGVTPVNDIG
jgi:hypothetical protein